MVKTIPYSIIDVYSTVTSTTILPGDTYATGWKDFFNNVYNSECPVDASTCKFENEVFACGTGSTLGIGESCTFDKDTAI